MMTHGQEQTMWTGERITERAKYWQDLLIGHANFDPDTWIEAAMTEVRDDMQTALAAANAEVERLNAKADTAMECTRIAHSQTDAAREWANEQVKRLNDELAQSSEAHNTQMFHMLERLEQQTQALAAAQDERDELRAELQRLKAQQWQPVESGEIYFDFYIGTTADDRIRIRKVDALGSITNDFVTLPEGWVVSRLAAQEQDGEAIVAEGQEGDE